MKSIKLPAGGEVNLRQTPTGWLAIGVGFPRIGITAPTREGALRDFAEARASWIALREERFGDALDLTNEEERC